jgi:hypothetical protein
MTPKTANPIGGLLMVLFSVLGGCYLVWFLWKALSTGSVPGRLGAIHHAWSAGYTVSVASCFLGLGFVCVLIRMGLRFAGLIAPGKDKPRDG